MALDVIASPEPGITLAVDLNAGVVTALQLDNATTKAVTVSILRNGQNLWGGTFTGPGTVRQNVPKNRQAPWDDLTDQGWQVTASVGS